jgi:hypothetical protein
VSHNQIAKTQLVFREVNQRIADITSEQGDTTSQFMCECGQRDCTAVIHLSLAGYRSVRDSGDFFVVAPGHCVEGVDRRVESRDGFDILVQA